MQLDLFLNLQKKVGSLRTQKDKLTGMLSQRKKEMKANFGTQTTKEARAKAKKLRMQEKVLEEEIQKALNEYEEKYGEKLQ